MPHLPRYEDDLFKVYLTFEFIGSKGQMEVDVEIVLPHHHDNASTR